MTITATRFVLLFFFLVQCLLMKIAPTASANTLGVRTSCAFAAGSANKKKRSAGGGGGGGGGGFGGFGSSSTATAKDKKINTSNNKNIEDDDQVTATEASGSASTATQHRNQNHRIETIDMGRDKKVRLYVPRDELNQQLKNKQPKKKSKNKKKKKAKQPTGAGDGRDAKTILDEYYGTGDVIWPSSHTLSRFLVHCPSLLSASNVLEIGCGLGLVSTSVLTFNHENFIKSVTLTDRDKNVLNIAYKSCTELALNQNGQNDEEEQQARPVASTSTTSSEPSNPIPETSASTPSNKRQPIVSKCVMDWTDQTTWPKGVAASSSSESETTSTAIMSPFDVLLASDVLYDKDMIIPLSNVLNYYLLINSNNNDNDDDGSTTNASSSSSNMKRAWIVDPIKRINRDLFVHTINEISEGLLEVECIPFPGMEKQFVLLSVTPTALEEEEGED